MDRPPVCDYEGSDYQSAFWDTGARQYEDHVEAVALKRLLPAGGKLLLELGAGAGRNTPRYAGFDRVVLLDYSLTQLQQAQARLASPNKYVYVAADVYHLPFIENLFDAATMIRVLHHLADVDRALGQIAAALAPGATFILEFANKRNLKAMLRYLLGRQSWSPYSRDPIEFVKLNFDFHPAMVRDALHKAGFSTQRQLSVSHFRADWFKRLIPLGILVAMDSFLQPTGSLIQFSPSIFTQNCVIKSGKPVSAPADPWGMFKCPTCNSQPLSPGHDALICYNCGARYPIRDGVYDFRAAGR